MAMLRLRRALAAIITGLLAVLALSSCGYSTPSDMVAVHVGEGPFEARHLKGCIQPSQRGWWTNDTYALFPTSEREWDATGQKGSDGPKMSSVTKDSVEMDIPTVTNCGEFEGLDTSKGSESADSTEQCGATGAPGAE